MPARGGWGGGWGRPPAAALPTGLPPPPAPAGGPTCQLHAYCPLLHVRKHQLLAVLRRALSGAVGALEGAVGRLSNLVDGGLCRERPGGGGRGGGRSAGAGVGARRSGKAIEIITCCSGPLKTWVGSAAGHMHRGACGPGPVWLCGQFNNTRAGCAPPAHTQQTAKTSRPDGQEAVVRPEAGPAPCRCSGHRAAAWAGCRPCSAHGTAHRHGSGSSAAMGEGRAGTCKRTHGDPHPTHTHTQRPVHPHPPQTWSLLTGQAKMEWKTNSWPSGTSSGSCSAAPVSSATGCSRPAAGCAASLARAEAASGAARGQLPGTQGHRHVGRAALPRGLPGGVAYGTVKRAAATAAAPHSTDSLREKLAQSAAPAVGTPRAVPSPCMHCTSCLPCRR